MEGVFKDYTVRVDMTKGDVPTITVAETIGIKTTILNIIQGIEAEELYKKLLNK